MKSYTDLGQSEKLYEILSIEKADMEWIIDGLGEPFPIPVNDKVNPHEKPCWSLAALLNVLPILDNRSSVLSKTFDGEYKVVYRSTAYEKAIITSDYDNPVDACYEMIIKLYKLNLL